MLLPPPDISAPYTEQGGKATKDFFNWVRSLFLELQPKTVTTAQLGTGRAGQRAVVSDANATTFASIVAGGGANIVPVYYDGTDWRIG